MDRMARIKELLLSMEGTGFRSQDHYDFWSRAPGIFLRRNRSAFTMPFIGLAFMADLYLPGLMRIGVRGDLPMEVITDILHGMRFYGAMTDDDRFEQEREMLLRQTLARLTKTEHGVGLGHQFNWYTERLLPAGTPTAPISATLANYLLDEFAAGRGTEEARKVISGIGEMIHKDLERVDMEDGSSSLIYSPSDPRRVVNANGFSMLILFKIGEFLKRPEYKELAARLCRYLINQQGKDGEWYYFERGAVPEDSNFIDGFHSCFVVESMMEYAELSGDEEADRSYRDGLEFFTSRFILPGGRVRHFMKRHLPVEAETDTRCNAEAVYLLALASKEYPGLYAEAERIMERLDREMYNEKGGYYYHRRYGFGLHKGNYYRWGNGPVLRALVKMEEAKL